MTDTVVYEPRSLWSIANVQAVADSDPQQITVSLNRRHFTNGTRWPIYLRRIVLSGVNYLLNTPADPTVDQLFFMQGLDIINRVRVSFSAPFRYHLNSKLNPDAWVSTGSLTPRPTWEPPPFNPSTDNLSNNFGTSQLKFDYPLYIPRTASVEWQLSRFSPFLQPNGNPQLDMVKATMLYQESGGMFFGNARTHTYTLQPWLPPVNDQPPSPFLNTEEKWPFPPDNFSFLGTFSDATRSDWWEPRGLFNTRQFNAQNATRDGSTEITDIRATLNQLAYDQNINTQFQTEFGVPLAERIAPLCTRVGTRIRTVGCGSGAWWWRPGAPMALVMDTITPALVYQLPQEIVLEPGDSLDVQMIVDNSTEGFESNFDVPYHIGVSFNGHSPIDG